MRTDEAATRKEAGQNAALARAGEEWTIAAVSALRLYIDARRRMELGDEFDCEQFRVWATAQGRLQEPESANAWGSVPKIAVAAGMIEPTGRVRETKRPAAHSRLIRIWRAR